MSIKIRLLSATTSKLFVLSCLLILLFPNWSTLAQDKYSTIPSKTDFSPDLEMIEDDRYGITIYDQYASFNENPLTRELDGSAMNVKKHEDYYANKALLHEGTYVNGQLQDYRVYYPSGNLERSYEYDSDGKGTKIVYYHNETLRDFEVYDNYELKSFRRLNFDGEVYEAAWYHPKKEYLELLVEADEKMRKRHELQLIDKKSFMYLEFLYDENGELIEEGELQKVEGGWEKEGIRIRYKDGKEVYKAFYENNKEMEVMIEDNGMIVESIDNTNDNESNTEEANPTSSLPAELARFDLNSDNSISLQELDKAVSDFFDDETIEVTSVNKLVNFFFDQD